MPSNLALRPDDTSPADARLFVTHWARTWGYRSLIPAAALLTSELATNAVVHAAEDFEVEVANTGHGIHVAVTDPSTAQAAMVQASEVTEHGRGLRVVDAVASSWGVDRMDGSGKSVWFELDVREPDAHLGQVRFDP
ncbi:MAG: ATP-binding protein [Acidimicrobiales bacterium]